MTDGNIDLLKYIAQKYIFDSGMSGGVTAGRHSRAIEPSRLPTDLREMGPSVVTPISINSTRVIEIGSRARTPRELLHHRTTEVTSIAIVQES